MVHFLGGGVSNEYLNFSISAVFLGLVIWLDILVAQLLVMIKSCLLCTK